SSSSRRLRGLPNAPRSARSLAGFQFHANTSSRRRASTEMKILGISGHYHDAAAALVIDGAPVCAVQEERLSRHKNDAAFPLGAIEWCLDHTRISPADLDAVVFHSRSIRKFHRHITRQPQTHTHSWRSLPTAIKTSLGEKVWVRGII